MNGHAYKVVELKELTPYAQNPRTHSDAQVQQIRRSIREFGFTNPLLIDEDNGIIAGHGRYLAAAAEGIREVPTIVVAGLSDAKRRALVLADNQIALNAGWNDELLRAELVALEQTNLEMSLIGFSQKELDRLMRDADALAADAAAQLNGSLAYRVIVDCSDESQQRELIARFESEGLSCKPLIS